VVARAITGGAQSERRQRRAGAGVAVRNDFFRVTDGRTDLLGGRGLAGTGEQILHVHVTGAGNAALTGVARIAVLAAELLVGPDVEDRQSWIVEPPCQLLARRDGVEARFERRL